jgi:hypothetical protein
MAIRNKLIVKKPTLPTPDYTEYFEFLSRDLDFLDDSRMTPSNESFETVTTQNFNGTGLGFGDWEFIYRASRDSYIRYVNLCMPEVWNRQPIKTKEISKYHTEGQLFGQGYSTWANQAPEYPSAENTLFYANFPLKKVKTKIRISMLESAKLFEGFNDYVYLVNNVDPETGQWVGNNEITNELDNVVIPNTITYFNLAERKSNGETLTEQEELDLVDMHQDFVNKYTNPNYYPSSSWTGEGLHANLGPNRAGVVLGVDDLNWLPSVSRMRDIPATGNPGDAFYLACDAPNGLGWMTWYWNESTNEWKHTIQGSAGDVEDTFSVQRARREAKLLWLQDLIVTCKPFTWAAYYIPKYKIEKDIL